MPVGQKIVEVMKRVGCLSKDKKLTGGGNYNYLSEEKVTGELHGAFAEVGLVVFPSSMQVIDEREDTTKSQSVMHNVRIYVSYCFMDPDDGTTLTVNVFGEGQDMGDKVMNKCMTGALKYALRQTFLISTGDDPDHHASSEQESTGSRYREQAPPRPQPAARSQPAPPASSSGEPTATMRDWFNRMAQVPGLMEPDPEREGKYKPSGEWYHMCRRYQLPNAWSKYTPEEYARAIAICDIYAKEQREQAAAASSAPQPTPEPAGSGNLYPDAPSDMGDPFANQ